MSIDLDRVAEWALAYRSCLGNEPTVEVRRDAHAWSVAVGHEVGFTEMLLIVWLSGEMEVTLSDGRCCEVESQLFHRTEDVLEHCVTISEKYAAIRDGRTPGNSPPF